MKKIVYILLLITLPSLTSLAQKLETAGIVSIYTQGIGASDDLGESLYRIEVTKTEKSVSYTHLTLPTIFRV